MGNHSAATAMIQTALAVNTRRTEGDTALAILDLACKPYTNCDAEFDGREYPGEPFGDILIEAFAPHGLADKDRYLQDIDREGESETWWKEVKEPFKARYTFW